MTPLDQAFIKVYRDRGEALSAPRGSVRPRAGEDAPEHRTAEGATGIAVGASIDDLSRVRGGTADSGGPFPPEEAVEVANAPEDLGKPATTHRIDAGSSAGCAGDQRVCPPHMRVPEADAAEEAEGLPDVALRQQPAEQTFEPMLQVDRLTWPAICCRLAEAATDELSRLADALAEVAVQGRKVVAIGGCRRGEGATTLLLCAGRRLAERGLKVLVADANLAEPQVACRLGLLPEGGWEDVVAGRLPLEEVVIESVEDRLAVLPVCQTSSDAGPVRPDETRLLASIQTLAAHYDLVLLDPGSLEELGTPGASLACGIGGRLDAIVLVHHEGVTPAEDLDDVRRWLAETEIVQVGVIENLVRG